MEKLWLQSCSVGIRVVKLTVLLHYDFLKFISILHKFCYSKGKRVSDTDLVK